MLIGIDWGGTKIEAVALSPDGDLLDKRRVATPQGDYAGCIAAIARLVGEIESRLGRRGSVGVGIPGAISPATGLVMNANSTWNRGQRLDHDLARALDREVRVENDANCFAVSEAVDGAGRGERVVWGVIIGTGAGSGIAIDGVALGGRNRIAGEWGHNPLPWPRDEERPGPACFCGRSGCIETFVSGTGFARDHNAKTGQALRAEEIVAAMRAGDAGASASFERYRDRLARAIAHAVNILDPDVIVLGGGMSNIEELYADLATLIEPWVFSDSFATPVLRHIHGDSSGVRGAAWLWKS
jgi:fructokinase